MATRKHQLHHCAGGAGHPQARQIPFGTPRILTLALWCRPPDLAWLPHPSHVQSAAPRSNFVATPTLQLLGAQLGVMPRILFCSDLFSALRSALFRLELLTMPYRSNALARPHLLPDLLCYNLCPPFSYAAKSSFPQLFLFP